MQVLLWSGAALGCYWKTLVECFAPFQCHFGFFLGGKNEILLPFQTLNKSKGFYWFPSQFWNILTLAQKDAHPLSLETFCLTVFQWQKPSLLFLAEFCLFPATFWWPQPSLRLNALRWVYFFAWYMCMTHHIIYRDNCKVYLWCLNAFSMFF